MLEHISYNRIKSNSFGMFIIFYEFIQFYNIFFHTFRVQSYFISFLGTYY